MAARKTRNAPQAPADAGTENGQPVATTREAAVRALIEKGKKRGSLTYDEIAAISAALLPERRLPPAPRVVPTTKTTRPRRSKRPPKI